MYKILIRKYLILFYLGILFFGIILSCKPVDKDSKTVITFISNQVLNDSLRVYDSRLKRLLTIPMESGITRKDTLSLLGDSYCKIFYNKKILDFYLEQGSDITLQIDTTKSDVDIIYSGNRANLNNYFAKKERIYRKAFGVNMKSFYSQNHDSYYKDVTNFKNENEHLLKLASKNIDNQFIERETKNIKFQYLTYLQKYQGLFEYYKGIEYNPKNTPSFLSELKNIDFYNEKNYKNFGSYRSLVNAKFSRLSKEMSVRKGISEGLAIMTLLKDRPNGELKDELISAIGYNLLNPSDDAFHKVYNMHQQQVTDSVQKNKFTKKYNKLKKLGKGTVSELFKYEDIHGNMISLTDLKGSYVYIDIWATWCKPCLREVPFLKKLEHDYKDKNIKFVSISVDRKKNKEKWVNMVTEKELGGIQLFANDPTLKTSPFLKSYNVQGIPHFILIDPEGKIISAKAPRPSDSNISDLFGELL